MKFTDFVKNEKVICFAGGIAAAVCGAKVLKSEKTRKACVSGLAKCMKLRNDAQAAIQNVKDEAEDICYDARCEAESAE
jgi:hypothetical protein